MFTEKEKQRIIYLNERRYSYKEMAEELNTTECSLQKFFKENNIKKIPYKKDKFLREDFFTNITTEEQAYLLGLFKTDGYIKKRSKGQTLVGISLKSSDKYMIEKIKELFNSNRKIYHDGRMGKECDAIEINSEIMVKDLSKFEIIPRKTYLLKDIHIEQIPKHLQRHYLRGLLDGDGTVCYDTGYLVVGFCGYNEEFVRSFQYAIDEYLERDVHNVIKKENAYNCKWKGKQCLKILEYLYKDSTIALERKKKFYIDNKIKI